MVYLNSTSKPPARRLLPPTSFKGGCLNRYWIGHSIREIWLAVASSHFIPFISVERIQGYPTFQVDRNWAISCPTWIKSLLVISFHYVRFDSRHLTHYITFHLLLLLLLNLINLVIHKFIEPWWSTTRL